MINHADNTSGSDPRPNHLEESLLHDLSRPVAGPDLTQSIMGRLGYMRVSSTVAQRRRHRRFAGRIGLVCTTALVMSVGALMHLNGPNARRPADITIPAAIGSDVEQQNQRLDSVIQTIRSLTPVTPTQAPAPKKPAPPRPPEKDINRSSIGPVQWV